MTQWFDQWFSTPLIGVLILSILVYLLKLAHWKGGVDKDTANLKENADRDRSEIRSFMEEIRNDIKQIFSRLQPLPVAGSSPLRLTDFGKKISSSIEAEEWANELAPTLLDDVQGKQPFEVDEFCQDYVQQKLSDLWQGKVAGCAYEFGIDKDGVLAVLRVVLRDALLRSINT